jgi:hypothetical protein
VGSDRGDVTEVEGEDEAVLGRYLHFEWLEALHAMNNHLGIFYVVRSR